MSTIAGGVIGSVLTLTILPQTGYLEMYTHPLKKKFRNFWTKMKVTVVLPMQ